MTTNDPSHYQAVGAGASDTALGNSAGHAGDYLESLIITVNTAASAAVSIKDGGGSSIGILPNSPGGGIGVYQVWITCASKAGPWKITTGAGSTVLAIGTFT